jgi:hypothetical protein
MRFLQHAVGTPVAAAEAMKIVTGVPRRRCLAALLLLAGLPLGCSTSAPPRSIRRRTISTARVLRQLKQLDAAAGNWT